jgi:hypothetical protein
LTASWRLDLGFCDQTKPSLLSICQQIDRIKAPFEILFQPMDVPARRYVLDRSEISKHGYDAAAEWTQVKSITWLKATNAVHTILNEPEPPGSRAAFL